MRRLLLPALAVAIVASASTGRAIHAQREQRRCTVRRAEMRTRTTENPIARGRSIARVTPHLQDEARLPDLDIISRPPPPGFDVPGLGMTIMDEAESEVSTINVETLVVDLCSQDATLKDLVHALRSIGVRVQADADSSALNHTAAIDFRGVLVRPVLQWIAAEYGVACEIRGGGVRITSALPGARIISLDPRTEDQEIANKLASIRISIDMRNSSLS